MISIILMEMEIFGNLLRMNIHFRSKHGDNRNAYVNTPANLYGVYFVKYIRNSIITTSDCNPTLKPTKSHKNSNTYIANPSEISY